MASGAIMYFAWSRPNLNLTSVFLSVNWVHPVHQCTYRDPEVPTPIPRVSVSPNVPSVHLVCPKFLFSNQSVWYVLSRQGVKYPPQGPPHCHPCPVLVECQPGWMHRSWRAELLPPHGSLAGGLGDIRLVTLVGTWGTQMSAFSGKASVHH